MNFSHCFTASSRRRKHKAAASENVTPPTPHASFPFGVIDRCCSLFIWSGFNNMKPIARSGACCCLYGPLSVSCPLIEKWERQREGEEDESEMCYILWEEAKWKQGNLGDQYRARSREPAGWSENTKQGPFPSFFLCSPSFLCQCVAFCLFAKAFSLVLVFFKKKKHKKTPSNMKVTLLALGYMPCHFSPTPQKQRGDPVNSLAEQIMWKCWQQQIWAEWVI